METRNNTKEREVRTFTLDGEFRQDGDGKLVGHAAVFNEFTSISGFFEERIAPGAFKKSIKTDDIRALINHDSNFVLGRNTAGTLTLKEDDRGLAVTIDTPDTSFGRDLNVSIERGDISQMSFGFQAIKETWEEEENKPSRRTLEEVRLFDVSPVTFPAYENTDIAVRNRQLQQEARTPKRLDIYKMKLKNLKRR